MTFTPPLLLLFFLITLTKAFLHPPSPKPTTHLFSLKEPQPSCMHRTTFLKTILFTTGACITTSSPRSAEALVKGNAPPPKMKPSGERKCTNVEECQEMAEIQAQKEAEELRAQTTPASIAPKGSRYKDIIVGDETLQAVKDGDAVKVKFKVLKLGKRSYDGLSGEGTVVFSRGYGLEDDESAPNKKTFTFTISDPSTILALSDAVPGMYPNGIRRISVSPQMGWERATQQCDGGPGGKGSGGDLKTDYVVVPTATMVATEICFDKEKKPFPTTYAQERRMAQRFDQSLIMEVELVEILG